MKNEIKEYKEYINKQAADPDTDKKKLAEELLVRIGFYQHERLSDDELRGVFSAVADTCFYKGVFPCTVGASACTACAVYRTLLFP